MCGVRKEAGVLEVPYDHAIWSSCNPSDGDDGAVRCGQGYLEFGDLPPVCTFGSVGLHQRREVVLLGQPMKALRATRFVEMGRQSRASQTRLRCREKEPNEAFQLSWDSS